MIRPIHACFSALMLFAGVGCTVSEYVDNYQYEPHPAMAEISAAPGPQPIQPAPTQPAPGQVPANAAPQPAPPAGPPVISAYATVVGIYRGNADEKIPASVEVRLRIENHGPPTAVFDPHSFELIDGEMMRLPSGIIHPDQPINIPPMKSATLDVFFPFPPGHNWENTDLQSLRAHWQVLVDGHPVDQMVEFHRVYYRVVHRYYGPYDDPYYPYPVYGGVVVVHRRW